MLEGKEKEKGGMERDEASLIRRSRDEHDKTETSTGHNRRVTCCTEDVKPS